MPFDVKLSRTGEALVLELTGEFVLGQNLRSASQAVREAGAVKGIIVDLSGCRRVDSAGLGEMLLWYSIATKEHKKLLLTGVRDNVREMMRIARVDGVLLIVPDREAALAAL